MLEVVPHMPHEDMLFLLPWEYDAMASNPFWR